MTPILKSRWGLFGLRFVAAAVSVGWILPFWLAADTVLTWIQLEVEPRLSGHEPMVNSFPFIHFARDCVIVGSVWLAVVLFGWILFVTRRRPNS